MPSYIEDEIQSPKLQFTQQGMAASRVAKCSWVNWPLAVLELMGTPIVFNGVLMVIGRQNFPGMPGLLVDTVDVEGFGRITAPGTWNSGPNYRWGRLSVNYKIPEFEDSENENTGEGGQWLIESLDYACEIATVPVVVVDEADKKKLEQEAKDLLLTAPSSNEDGQPAPIPVPNREAKKKTIKRHVRLPTITYKVTIPRIGTLPSAAIQASIGTLNKSAIFGGKTGTVLFDGPNAERESALFTQRFWRISYQFIYNPHGWNNVLHPDTLKWVPAKAAGSDNDAYEYTEHRNLFPPPYKVK